MKYRRSLLSVGFLALVAPSFALDYETSGETLKSLFPKLSSELGMPIRVNADVENEVVVIRARNVEPLTLLRKISDATGLTWIQEEGGYRLYKHFETEQKAAAEYRAYTISGWNNWKQNPNRNQPSPVDTIMLDFQPEQLSNLTIGGRLVFADRPNRNQIAMTTNVRSLATSTIQKQHQDRVTAMENQYAQRPNERFRALIDNLKTPPVKVLLIVRRQSLNTFSATLQGLDSNGNAQYNLSGVYVLTNPDTNSDAVSNWNLKEDAPSRVNLKTLTSSSQTSGNTNTGSLRDVIMNPVKNEPFAFAIGPALIESAPAEQNFVACLPDESFDRIASALNLGGPSAMAGTGVTITRDADGWVIFSPQLKVHNWDTRRSRSALIPLVSKLASSGILSINDQADYAKSVTTWFSTNSWEYNIARRTLGSAASRELARIAGSQIEGLAIYNSLRAKLNGQNQVLPINSLSRDFITFTVFNSTSDPRIMQTQNAAGSVQRGGSVQIELAVQGQNLLQRGGPQAFEGMRRAGERTELYSGGLPTTGQIQVNVRANESFVVRSTDGSSQSIMSDGDLTRFRASQLSSNIRMRDGGVSATNNVFGATRSTTISFDIQFADGTSFSRSVSGTDAPSQFVSYSGLPQNLLTRIEREANEMATRANQQPAQGRGNGRRGGGNRGGGTPPPQ